MKWWKLVVLVAVSVGVVWLIWRWRDEQKGGVVETSEVGESYKVAIVADIHNDNDNLTKVLDQESNMVILVGDLTNTGTDKELQAIKSVLDASGKEYYLVPGNHDRWAKKFDNYFSLAYQSFVRGDIKWILIDNSSWRGLGEVQWQWLRKELPGCLKIKCVAVAHMPLNHLWSGHVMGEESDKVKEEAGDLLRLLVDNGVTQMYSGHLHYADSYEIGGLRTNLVGAVTRARSKIQQYTEVVVKGDEITSEVVRIE